MKDKLFFYDGDCAFCTKLSHWLQSFLTDSSVQFISFREMEEEQLLKIHPELNLYRLEGEVQLIVDGKRYPGFFAVRKLFFYLKYFRWINFFLYLPLIPFLGMLVMYILKKRAAK
jgi:predicted DCC family thiol-disulfide oxidoreductase YuxK